MVRLPLPLQRRLTIIFPDEEERQSFIVDTLELAIRGKHEESADAVGGTLHLFTDGGSRGNPGQAAIGCLLIDPSEDKILSKHSECIGVETNNIAEYKALIAGIKMAQSYHPNTLICHMDSELVVKQLTGEYRVKMPTFQPLIHEILQLKSQFPALEFRHIPRSKNMRADALVNQALDNAPPPPLAKTL